MFDKVSDILGGVAQVFRPVADLIDDVHTSEEEKFKLKNQLVSLQNDITIKQMDLVSQTIELEKKLLDSQASIITAEANSQSWIARNWRPVTMLTFVFVTTLHALGLIDMDATMSNNYFTLVQIGLGGYVAGRSLEKVAPAIAGAIAKK